MDGLIALSLLRSTVGQRTQQLLPTATALVSYGIASSSRDTYMTGSRHFLSFLTFYGIRDLGFPPSPELLIFFTAYLFLVARGRTSAEGTPRGAAATTLLGYLSGVRSLCIDLGVSISAFHDPRVRRCRRALKRLRSRAVRTRLPVTILCVARLQEVTDSLLGPHEAIMIKGILRVGVYALLRSGEMVAKSASASAPLLRRHILWHLPAGGGPPQWADLVIEASKTDWCRQGATVRIFRNNSVTCPVIGLQKVWEAAPLASPLAPVFQDSKGKALSYAWLQRSLKKLVSAIGLDPSLYSAHSLRIGGATSLAMLGVSPDIIKHMGRWRSLSYQLYVRINDDSVRAAQAGLAALTGAGGPDRAGLFGGWPVERAIKWTDEDLESISAHFTGRGG